MKVFDERVIKRFAFMPTLLDDGETVWLKFYNVLQVFGIHSMGSIIGHPTLSKNHWCDKNTFK